jgi:hypothetical protein
MSNDSTIAEALRAARGEVDLITKLKSGSLEARRERIAEALQNPDWDGGPAELIASYPHHAIASKEGILMRIPIDEEDGSIIFGKADVFSVPTPVADIGAEVMETAKQAVGFLLSEDFDSADPMIRGIAGALDVKGDLHRRLSMAVQLKSLSRKTWWQETVGEQFAADVVVPESVQSSEVEEMAEAISAMSSILKESSAFAVQALMQLHDAGTPNTGAIECAGDIAEDLKSALSILNDVNCNDLEEMTQVHEEVRQVMPRLLAGINFLTHLTGATSKDSGQE